MSRGDPYFNRERQPEAVTHPIYPDDEGGDVSEIPLDPKVEGFRACLGLLTAANDPTVIGLTALAVEFELGLSPCRTQEELSNRAGVSKGRMSQVIKPVREQIALILQRN